MLNSSKISHRYTYWAIIVFSTLLVFGGCKSRSQSDLESLGLRYTAANGESQFQIMRIGAIDAIPGMKYAIRAQCPENIKEQTQVTAGKCDQEMKLMRLKDFQDKFLALPIESSTPKVDVLNALAIDDLTIITPANDSGASTPYREFVIPIEKLLLQFGLSLQEELLILRKESSDKEQAIRDQKLREIEEEADYRPQYPIWIQVSYKVDAARIWQDDDHLPFEGDFAEVYMQPHGDWTFSSSENDYTKNQLAYESSVVQGKKNEWVTFPNPIRINPHPRSWHTSQLQFGTEMVFAKELRVGLRFFDDDVGAGDDFLGDFEFSLYSFGLKGGGTLSCETPDTRITMCEAKTLQDVQQCLRKPKQKPGWCNGRYFSSEPAMHF